MGREDDDHPHANRADPTHLGALLAYALLLFALAVVILQRRLH